MHQTFRNIQENNCYWLFDSFSVELQQILYASNLQICGWRFSVCINAVNLMWIRSGDVVVSSSPMEAGRLVCKRLAAMEGDEVYVPSENEGLLRGKTIVVISISMD